MQEAACVFRLPLRHLALLLLLLLGTVPVWADKGVKPVDDGAGTYAKTLVDFHSKSGNSVAGKSKTEAFAVSFFGWKALRLAQLPINSFEAAHLNVCRLVLSLYDVEIDPTLVVLASRAQSPTRFIDATKAEQDVIQKFVAGKYRSKYVLDLDTMAKREPVGAWQYSLGAALGELAGKLTQWFSIPNNADYDKDVAASLGALNKLVQDAPPGTSPELLGNLKALAALGAGKVRFSLEEQYKIGAQLKSTLLSTMVFAR